MSRALSPSSGRAYGLARVGRVWRASRATVYRHLSSRPEPPRRPGPVGPMPDAALFEAIRAVLTASPFTARATARSGPGCAWRAFARPSGGSCGSCASTTCLRRPGSGRPEAARHDGTIIPEAVDTMWGTDMTTTLTGEGQVAVFVAVDHYSAECVGIHAARRATRFEALEPIRQGVRRHFGAVAKRSRAVSPSGTITDRSTCPTTSSRSSPSWASRARPPSCEPRGQRLRRALHPHPEGEPALGADLRYRRRAPPGPAGLSRGLQHHLAHRTAWVPDTRGRAEKAAFTRGHGRVASIRCLTNRGR